jgi:hypothetical protein
MNKFFLSTFLLVFSAQSFAQDLKASSLKYVPGGSVVELKKDEVKVKAPAGSVIEIEFNRNGELDEASGDAIESDIFIPGNGYKNLSEISKTLKDQGYQFSGDWSFESSFMKSWHYEVDAIKEGQTYEVEIDAKTGKITKSKIED